MRHPYWRTRVIARISRLLLSIRGQPIYEIERAGGWGTFRRGIIEASPICAACGGTRRLQVHHKRPYHLFPELELVEDNCIVLCDDGPGRMSCHHVIGHGGNWMSYNPCVVADAENFRRMLRAMKWSR